LRVAKYCRKNRKTEIAKKIQVYDQLEIQARRLYKDVTQNQFKRINKIINDETRFLLERLRELFRLDGLTIWALITASDMVISTIFLAVYSRHQLLHHHNNVIKILSRTESNDSW